MSLPVDRKALRSQMRKKRRQLSTYAQKQAAQKLARHWKHTPDFFKAKSLAAYLANDGEIDPATILRFARKYRKKCYLPVLHPVRQNHLWFYPYTPQTRLIRNTFGILEPSIKGNTGRRPAWSISQVLFPLVAFDKNGGRLGMGGGFYDRTFEFVRKRSSTVKLVGLAHDFQCVDRLPVEAWDIPMQGILTDKNYYASASRTNPRH